MKINCYNTEGEDFILTIEGNVAKLGLLASSIGFLTTHEMNKHFKCGDVISGNNEVEKIIKKIPSLNGFDRALMNLVIVELESRQKLSQQLKCVHKELSEFAMASLAKDVENNKKIQAL